MATLHIGNNLTELKQRTNQLSNSRKTSRNWLIISPQQVILHGMMLTGNLNIQNIHQHLSMNFKIKPYFKGQQAKFVQVFPEKGSIMRGEIKKFRVKLARDFKPQLNDNGSMIIKIFVNLNTEWNKQYMITNRLRGWQQIKDLPIEEYLIPILISDEYQDIKQNIRNSLLFESQFGKVSQDLSSLYGDEKFQIPEMDNPNKNNFVRSKENPRYSQLEPFYEKKRMSTSENKGSRSSVNANSPKREVYFGNAPRMVQSKIELDQSLRRSRAGSVRKDYTSKNSGILQINTPVRDKERFEIPKVKQSYHINNPFSQYNEQKDLFKNFSDPRIPIRQDVPAKFEQQDSSLSILKSLEPQSSPVSEYKYRQERSNYQNNSRNQERSVFKDFNTVNNDFTVPGNSVNQSNKRSMELVVLAVIAGFFVALGSNIGRWFS